MEYHDTVRIGLGIKMFFFKVKLILSTVTSYHNMYMMFLRTKQISNLLFESLWKFVIFKLLKQIFIYKQSNKLCITI